MIKKLKYKTESGMTLGLTINSQHKDYPAYRQKCAEIDGWKFHIENALGLRWYKLPPCRNLTPEYELPTYLDDASIDAVVRKLDINQLAKYHQNLCIATG